MFTIPGKDGGYVKIVLYLSVCVVIGEAFDDSLEVCSSYASGLIGLGIKNRPGIC